MREQITTIEQVYQLHPEFEQDITLLKEWLAEQLHLPQLSDMQLVPFLNSSAKSLEAAKTCIDAYFTIKGECPEFFTSRDPLGADIESVSKSILIAPLSRLSPEGYRYIWFCMRDLDPTIYIPEHALKLHFMVMDIIIKDDPLSPGFIVVSDIQGFNLALARKISLNLLRKNAAYVQDGLPNQLREIHVLNVSPIINVIMPLITPFTKKKYLDMIKFHPAGETREELFKSIPRECLPREYDGEDKNLEKLYETTLEKMRSNRDWFMSEAENYKVDETKRKGKKGYNLNSCSLQ